MHNTYVVQTEGLDAALTGISAIFSCPQDGLMEGNPSDGNHFGWQLANLTDYMGC